MAASWSWSCTRTASCRRCTVLTTARRRRPSSWRHERRRWEAATWRRAAGPRRPGDWGAAAAVGTGRRALGRRRKDLHAGHVDVSGRRLGADRGEGRQEKDRGKKRRRCSEHEGLRGMGRRGRAHPIVRPGVQLQHSPSRRSSAAFARYGRRHGTNPTSAPEDALFPASVRRSWQPDYVKTGGVNRRRPPNRDRRHAELPFAASVPEPGRRRDRVGRRRRGPPGGRRSGGAESPATAAAFFKSKIRPGPLAESCVKCHGANKSRGGLRPRPPRALAQGRRERARRRPQRPGGRRLPRPPAQVTE